MESRLECPFCKTLMDKVKRNDVTVDKCPSCRGIWLDKDELDKIITRKKEKKNWGRPRVGTRPPSEDDDVSILVEW